jgi:hypothetical protein
MIRIPLLLTFISLSLIACSQVFFFEDGNPEFQDRLIFENIDTTNIWKFKPNLGKGKYWVIEQTECGPDTLKYAEYIQDGVKHGTWTQWESGFCVGSYKDNSEEIEKWDFVAKKFKEEEDIYDSGYLVKSTLYHIGSEQPVWENFYPEKTTQINQWHISKIWSQEGILRSSTTLVSEGIFEQKDFHENGILKAKGNKTWSDKYDKLIGIWLVWDEAGELMAEIAFKKGKPKKILRYQDGDLPFWAEKKDKSKEAVPNKR